MTNDIKRSPLVEQVIAYLTGQIETEAWPVGFRLPSEGVLAGELGVGRSTVREAVRALAHRGLLEVRQGSGTYVRATTPSDEGDPGWQTRLRRAKVADVYEVRRALELEAARLAAVRRTPDDLRQIEEALARRQEARAKAPHAEFVEADLTFHLAVVQAAHNPVLSELFGLFVAALQEALTLLVTDPELSINTSQAHADLFAAIQAGDPSAAVAATLANVDVTLEKLTFPAEDAEFSRSDAEVLK